MFPADPSATPDPKESLLDATATDEAKKAAEKKRNEEKALKKAKYDVVVLGKHEIMYLDERSARGRAAALEPTGDHPAIDEPDDPDEPGKPDGQAPAAGLPSSWT